ncbi:helix-turn-helix domain-containing protein [Streptomyces graminilatus]|uniref:helix-turn-helix domain-containing protein n=1 Tax=Streptomyces graminilatus TaxID=1464070 RepID=UPI0012FE9170|nr:helix-turn-helix transcriptional regulator [Streptomyces graminilatus]
MSDDETMPWERDDLPEHLRRPEDPVLSINQIVSYNLMRARRTHGWTQQDVAELLERYTGRSWSNASVSAAERAYHGGRPRRFDASEIVAMCKIFDEPISYFFMPPEDQYRNKSVGMREFPQDGPGATADDLMALIPTATLVEKLGMHKASAEFTDRLRRLALQWLGLSWKGSEFAFPFREVTLEDMGLEDLKPQEETSRSGVDIEVVEARELAQIVEQQVTDSLRALHPELVRSIAQALIQANLTVVKPKNEGEKLL